MSTASSGSASVKRTNPGAKQATNQADALLAQFMAVEDDASLAQRVREVVASNRRKAAARDSSSRARPRLQFSATH